MLSSFLKHFGIFNFETSTEVISHLLFERSILSSRETGKAIQYDRQGETSSLTVEETSSSLKEHTGEYVLMRGAKWWVCCENS